MAEKSLRAARPEIWIANKTFLVERNLWVRQGDTIVAGHPLLRGRKDYFRPFAPTFPLPEAEPEQETPAEAEAPEAEPISSEEAPA